jgi:hypothetical protein
MKEIENRNASVIDEKVTEKDNFLADIGEQIEDVRFEQEKGTSAKKKTLSIFDHCRRSGT